MSNIVHNPLLRLESAQKMRGLSRDNKAVIRELLMELSQDAAALAEHCWRKKKAPMASYWKAVSVYAKHAARLCREVRKGTIRRSIDAKD